MLIDLKTGLTADALSPRFPWIFNRLALPV